MKRVTKGGIKIDFSAAKDMSIGEKFTLAKEIDFSTNFLDEEENRPLLDIAKVEDQKTLIDELNKLEKRAKEDDEEYVQFVVAMSEKTLSLEDKVGFLERTHASAQIYNILSALGGYDFDTDGY